MGSLNDLRLKSGKPKVDSKPKTIEEVDLKFTKSELEALLIILGDTTFKGNQVEAVYMLAVKLQSGLQQF